jgi:integrase
MATIEKRETKNGSSFRVKVRLKGFPPQEASFKRLTDARTWAGATEAAIREGRYFKTAESRKHTFADLVDRYIKDVLPRKASAAQDAQKMQLLWWKSKLGHHTLADITPALITECRDELSRGNVAKKPGKEKKRGPATVNRYLAALSHAFTVAVNEWGWLDDTPMRKVTKAKEPRGRVRFLSDDERSRLLQACRESVNPNLYLVVVLALSTGMRRGEIMSLAWPQVDLKQGRITLYETKNKEIRVVPLAGHAAELLKAHNKVRPIDTDLLFPSQVNRDKPEGMEKVWQAALKKAEVADFRFHDLRHSAASYLAMNGASLAEIADVLGHKTLQMVKRYAHLSEAHTAKVVEKMNDRIFGG